MKFIYTQDEHLRIKNPRSRIDNYYESCMKKLEEICQIYKEEKCEVWISGGDLFDVPMVSYRLLDDFVDLIEKNKIRLEVMYGNHCMVGANLDNSSTTSLAHVVRRSKNIIQLEHQELSDSYVIDPYDFYFGIEQDINEKGLICSPNLSKPENVVKIAIVHALITEKPFFNLESNSVIGKFETNYDYMLVAHNHRAWGSKKVGNTTYINIGCLGRRKIDEYKNKPSCLIFEIGKEPKIIELKSAKKGEEVFDLTDYEEKKNFNKTIDDFVDMINSTKFQQQDLMDIILHLAKENDVSKDVTDCIVKRIGELENVK